MLDRILITNDDGIGAPGLAVLERIAAELAHEVWIVAPEHDQSGVSHAISLHHPVPVSERAAPLCRWMTHGGEAPARAGQKGIRIKTLKFLDSKLGKQEITGRRGRIGNDFQHQCGLQSERGRDIGS